jgi:disulfide bond formation protein DsbB
MTKEKLYILIPLYALALLAAALISQYGFGLLPCKLCLWQRVPYIFIAFAGTLAIFSKTLRPYLVIICAVAFFIDAGIAAFHVGVEQHWWRLEEECGSTITGGSTEDIFKQLMNAPAKRCDEPQFVLLGISMAGWNILAAVLGAALSIKSFVNAKTR